MKVTAYYARYIEDKYVSNAPQALRSSYTRDQIIEGIYNGGKQNYTKKVIPKGRFGDVVSG